MRRSNRCHCFTVWSNDHFSRQGDQALKTSQEYIASLEAKVHNARGKLVEFMVAAELVHGLGGCLQKYLAGPASLE